MKAGNAGLGNHKRTKIELFHFTMKVLQYSETDYVCQESFR